MAVLPRKYKRGSLIHLFEIGSGRIAPTDPFRSGYDTIDHRKTGNPGSFLSRL